MSKINKYTCGMCGGEIITRISDDSIMTPFTVRCMVKDGCGELMISACHQVPQDLKPTHEWVGKGSTLKLRPATS